MCDAFSCIITRNKKVIWKFGVDSHDQLLKEAGIEDKILDPEKISFCKIEISPKNKDYLNPDEWVFKIDMYDMHNKELVPVWWTLGHKTKCLESHKEWLKELDKILIRKPIINPFDIEPPEKITDDIIDILKEWQSVGYSVRESVRESVGYSVWESVRESVRGSVWESVMESVRGSVRYSVRKSVGYSVRYSVWESVRKSVGYSVRESVRESVGYSVWESVRESVRYSVRKSVGYSVRYSVWESVWESVRHSVWGSVWGYTGSFFNLPRTSWKYTESIECDGYPFESIVKLYDLGLVPSFDGKTWRLHGGKDAKIMWEGEI